MIVLERQLDSAIEREVRRGRRCGRRSLLRGLLGALGANRLLRENHSYGGQTGHAADTPTPIPRRA